EALSLGARETWEGVGQVIAVLKRIRQVGKNLGGPGSIVVAAVSEASQGWARLLVFLTLLSANLAVINMLPIPVLDGGHMMFLLYEGARGKPVNERIAFVLTMIGFVFILSLMLFVIGLDIRRYS
ncbi:MAG: site-2 protease family protein, partial [Planctomycetales bacterium]|nr:site-2 protease family protein [Planctomycetales bacterium]